MLTPATRDVIGTEALLKLTSERNHFVDAYLALGYATLFEARLILAICLEGKTISINGSAYAYING